MDNFFPSLNRSRSAALLLTSTEEEEYSQGYPVSLNHSALTSTATKLSAPLELFLSGPGEGSTNLTAAILAALRLNPSRISPDAYWSAADLGGFAYPSYSTSGRSATYLIRPLPVDSNGTEPHIQSFNFTSEEPPRASPYEMSYPPSGEAPGWSVLEHTLATQAVCAAYCDTAYPVMYYYYTVEFSARVNLWLLNGTQPCASSTGGVILNPCSVYPVLEFNVTGSSITGSYPSLTVTVWDSDTAFWNGVSFVRNWTIGSFTLSTYPDSVSQGNNTYFNVGYKFSEALNPPPYWVFPAGHAPRSQVYSHNYAASFLAGPGFYYSVYRRLYSLILSNTSAAYRKYAPWELQVFAGEIGLEMNVTDSTFTGSANPYESAYFTGEGNQSLVQRQQLLISDYAVYVYNLKGEFYNGTLGKYVPWSYSISANFSIPVWALENTTPYISVTVDETRSYAYLLDATNGEDNPVASFWFYNSTIPLYRPLPADGSTQLFHEYGAALFFPDVPFGYRDSTTAVVNNYASGPYSWVNAGQP